MSNQIVNHLCGKRKKILPKETFLINHHKKLKSLSAEVSKQTLLMSDFASFGTFWRAIFPVFIHLAALFD